MKNFDNLEAAAKEYGSANHPNNSMCRNAATKAYIKGATDWAEQGKEATPVDEKMNCLIIPTKAIKHALGYFKKDKLDDFVDTATDEEKWLFNELSKSYEAGAKDFHSTPKTTDELKQKYAYYLGVKNELDTSDGDAVEWAEKNKQ